MPNVTALKKFVKKKVNKRDNLASNIRTAAKKDINRLKIKQKTQKYIAEQKLYNKLMEFNNQLANNIVFSPVTQRLLSVTPLPQSVRKSIKKASPNTSGRTARRQTAKAGAIVLARKGIPRGPAQDILDKLLRSK